MKTIIIATMDPDTMNVKFTVESDCPSVKKMVENIPSISPYAEVGNHVFESDVYKAANEYLAHLACPVPCAAVKALEVASGLGLKRNVTLTIE